MSELKKENLEKMSNKELGDLLWERFAFCRFINYKNPKREKAIESLLADNLALYFSGVPDHVEI